MRYFNRIAKSLRWLYWKNRFGSSASRVSIGSHVTFQHPNLLHFGKGVGIGSHTYFLPCTWFAGVKYSPKIIIGDHCWIGIRNSFAAIDKVQIGNNVLFAGYVHITDHSHGFEDVDLPVMKQKLITKGPVIIEDDCWLGFGCEILSGVHIGKHSVVAARAVVTKDVPAYSVVAGNPARVVKRYNFETKQWERVQRSI